MQKRKTVLRLTTNAMLVALYVVLSLQFMTVNLEILGLKLTFEHFPVLLCGVLFGPIDAVTVGAIGEFINQATSQYGITLTTPLWILPIMVRGLMVGGSCKIFKKYAKKDSIVFYLLVFIVSGIFSSSFNTLALYVDSKIFGYYTHAMVFGVYWTRIIMSGITSILMGLLVTPIMYALRKSRLV